MGNAAVDVSVRLGLHDSATPGIDKFVARVKQAAEKTAEDVERGNARQRTSYERTSQAREVLGVRSEQRIQREIAQTEAAYNRLMRAGTLSAQEQARALETTRQKVTQLTNEMGKLTAAQEKSARAAEQQARGVKALQTGGAVVAGGAAAAYSLRDPIRQSMSFEERMAHMANTAFRERDKTGRQIGMKELQGAVDRAQQNGGGTREGAAEALDSLIASGAMSAGDAMAALPSITKAATAAKADPTQLADIGIRAMQTFKIKPEDLPNVLNMALASGQAGGFELRDMSKWLPQQMAAATMSGMSGKAGFAKLAALNQAAAITAGNKDEAGNNVVNLLSKINSADTAKDAEKMGVDLPKYLQQQKAKGVDSVDAFGALVQSSVSRRADYQELQKKLQGAGNDDERRGALEGMATIAQGAGIGKLVQDRQALMALLGMMNNSQYMSDVLKEVRGNDVRGGGAVDRNFEVISETGSYKARQRSQAIEAGQQEVIGGGGPLGAMNDAITSVATKFPVLTGSATLAATALGAAAAAAGVFTLAAGGGGGKAGGAITNAAGRVAGVAGTAAKYAGPVGAAGALGYGVGSVFSYLIDKGIQAGTGDKDKTLGTFIYDLFHKDSPMVESLKPKDVAPQPKPAEVNAKMTVGLAPGLVLFTQEFKANGANASISTGNIWQGAPG